MIQAVGEYLSPQVCTNPMVKVMVNVNLYSTIVTKSLNALSTLVAREKPGFQALSKGLIVLLCAEIVRQGVPDHGALHGEYNGRHCLQESAPAYYYNAGGWHRAVFTMLASNSSWSENYCNNGGRRHSNKK